MRLLWFDVGNERYTTALSYDTFIDELWFDVGNERYTTALLPLLIEKQLWFDVGNERYTTNLSVNEVKLSCGLM